MFNAADTIKAKMKRNNHFNGQSPSMFRPPKGLSKEEVEALRREFFHTQTKDIVKKFMETTTAHGWGRVALERTTVIKLFWVVLTLAAFGANVAHVLALVLQYLSFPSEQVSEVEMTAIEFPSVSICNIQPMSTSTGLELMNDPSSQLYQWDNLTRWYYDKAMEDGDLSYNEELAYNRLRQPVGFFENLGDESEVVGHQAFDFMLSCTFGVQKCTLQNMTFFQSPTYFNCYTFNGGNLTHDNLIARTTGPNAGLSLILYLESDNGNNLYNGTYHTLSNVGNAAGARVMVHSPNTRPSPVDKGFDIPPGFSSSVGIKVTKYDRLGSPYGDCQDELMYGSDMYIYSADTCITLCQQRFVMDRCRCVSSMLPIPEYNESNLKYCGNFDPTHQEYFFSNLTCEMEVMNLFIQLDNSSDVCGCYPPCDEFVYKTEVSYSYWPLDFTQTSFYESYVLNHPQRDQLKAYKNLDHFNKTEIISNGLIRKNFVRLNVYLKDLIVQEMVQKKSYEIQNLLGDMGGTFGLWIGMSIITWCEVLELLIRVFSRWMRKLTRSGEIDTELSTHGAIPMNKDGPSDSTSSPDFDPVTADALGFKDYVVTHEVQV